MVNTVKLIHSLKGGAIALVNKTASDVIDETIYSFRASKTGQQYIHLKNRSSAPGETPAWQTGELARSIKKDLEITPYSVTAIITVGADYAPFLVNRQRPILSPAVNKNRMIFKQGVIMLANKFANELQHGLKATM